jgi:hypothetical protein
MSKSNSNNGGVGFVGLLTIVFIVFIVLKLCKVITWSWWWWVLSPIWITTGIVIGIIGLAGLFIALTNGKTGGNNDFRCSAVGN